MGYSGAKRANTQENRIIAAKEEIGHLNIIAGCEVREPLTEGHGHVHYYAASTKANPCEIFAVVLLIEHRGGYLMVKSMDEGMEPYYYNASNTVLNALSDTTNKHANAWREKCRETNRVKSTNLMPYFSPAMF